MQIRNKVLGLGILGFTALSCAFMFTGCASWQEQETEYMQDRANAGLPVPLYRNLFNDIGTYNSLEHAKGDRLRHWEGAYTLADFELDSLIAGERQGDEQSMYLTTAPQKIKDLRKLAKLADNEYSPMIIEKFESPAGVKPEDFQREVYNNPRAVELDHNFNAMHKVSRVFVKNECKLIVDGMNDSLHGIFYFKDPKHDDLYMKRMWSVIPSQIAAFTYATTKDYSKADRTYFATDYPFIEELKGTEDEPNIILFEPHYSKQVAHGWVPNQLIPHYRKFYVSFYQCTPEQIFEARQIQLKYYTETLEAANKFRAKHGLELEKVEDPDSLTY